MNHSVYYNHITDDTSKTFTIAVAERTHMQFTGSNRQRICGLTFQSSTTYRPPTSARTLYSFTICNTLKTIAINLCYNPTATVGGKAPVSIN